MAAPDARTVIDSAARALTLLATFVLCLAPASAQQWHRVGADYSDVAQSGPSVIVVGDLGSIMVSSDGGDAWRYASSGTQSRLADVAFIDVRTAIAVGDSGLVLRTSDAGATWSRGSIYGAKYLTRVAFSGALRGHAVDIAGNLFGTTDGGITWEGVARELGPKPASIVAPTEGRLVALSDSGRILTSTDGGVRWNVAHESEHGLFALDFADSLNGYAGGFGGTLLRTTDGGATWSDAGGATWSDAGGGPGTTDILALTAASEADLLVVGAYGSNQSHTPIAASVDGGTSWEHRAMPYPILTTILLTAMDRSENAVFAVGNLGTIIRSTDDGATWTTISSATLDDAIGSRSRLWSIAATNGDTAIVVNNSAFGAGWSRTTDGGATWRLGIRNRTDSFRDPHFFDDSTGIVTTESHGDFFETTDAGRSWSPYPSTRTPDERSASSMHFVDGASGYLASDQVIFRTSDRGRTWTGTDIPWASYVARVHAVTPDVAHAVALSRDVQDPSMPAFRIYRTDDGGASWRVIIERHDVAMQFTDVFFITPRIGFVTMGRTNTTLEEQAGYILRTTDGGVSWDSLDVDAAVPNRIRFFNDRHGFVVGSQMHVWETTDGGDSWSSETLPGKATEGLLDIALLQQRRTLVVSGFGLLARKELAAPIPAHVDGEIVDRHVRRAARRIAVAPNPVTGNGAVLELEGIGGTDAASVAIIDVTGSTIGSHDLDFERHGGIGRAVIDVAGLAAGIYRVVVTGDEAVWTAPIIVVR